jgi:pyruvate/2-oxoglutarate/acetoin dehydrogenase E1 component/TPP-dependent pyruvate/acetoin dehydrogenase alpha subunit
VIACLLLTRGRACLFLLVLSYTAPFLRMRRVVLPLTAPRANNKAVGGFCQPRYHRYLGSISFWKDTYQHTHGKEMDSLAEQTAMNDLRSFLKSSARHNNNGISGAKHVVTPKPPTPPVGGYKYEMSRSQIRTTLDASMATFALHLHARIASLVGQGFYTIGPCGEELLSSAAWSFTPKDSVALHYRHVGVNIARQLAQVETTTRTNSNYGEDALSPNTDKALQEILLARARGYTVSRLDPVTGGVHCSIGGGAEDYIVTSTLASQCPTAVGRALGYALGGGGGGGGENNPLQSKAKADRPISFVTVGDGSVHNHHFLSALTLARHARHKKIKCPLVMGISDNGLSISYQTRDYVDTLFDHDPILPLFKANGNDMMDIYSQTIQATMYARDHSAPCILHYKDLVRRFGHAATDRQHAYLSAETIQAMADTDVLSVAIVQAVEQYNAITYAELEDRLEEILTWTEEAFCTAVAEPKVTLEDMIDQVAAPLVPIPRQPPSTNVTHQTRITSLNPKEKPQVMRKHMTSVVEEVLTNNPKVVYLGEDVDHGGYYLVTEGLAKKFPGRVMDFPPDETTLLGAAMGFSQVGLVPIVEIPYAKYLDVGVDMFYEIATMNWLSNGQRPNGMVIRLQGFDRGLFGGNFHTHNMLSHMPPGVDVVCFSNGEDYVKGFRHAIMQAAAGRVVVIVDCTNLLNLRHLHDKDRAWERVFPDSETLLLGFDDIRRYTSRNITDDSYTNARLGIVSYGNGVVTSLQVRRALLERGIFESEAELDIIDVPYLSGVPKGLKEILPQYQGIIFADICKEGPGSNVFSSMITSLQQDNLLPPSWSFVGAPRTYNPLGSTVTFLNSDRIEGAVTNLLKNQQKGHELRE